MQASKYFQHNIILSYFSAYCKCVYALYIFQHFLVHRLRMLITLQAFRASTYNILIYASSKCITLLLWFRPHNIRVAIHIIIHYIFLGIFSRGFYDMYLIHYTLQCQESGFGYPDFRSRDIFHTLICVKLTCITLFFFSL